MRLSVRSGVAACLGLLCSIITVPIVQAGEFEALGRVHLSFSPDEIVQSAYLDAFEPFDVYVLLEFDSIPPTGLDLGETGLRFHETVAFQQIDHLGSGYYGLFGLEPGLVQLVFGFRDCVKPSVGLTPVLRLVCVLQEQVSDVLIGIEAIESGSFEGLGPGWWGCDGSTFLFEQDPGGWSKLEINKTVAAEAESWSAIKARFQEVTP